MNSLRQCLNGALNLDRALEAEKGQGKYMENGLQDTKH